MAASTAASKEAATAEAAPIQWKDAKTLLSGAVAGVMSRTIVSPLERLKIIQQTQDMLHGTSEQHKLSRSVLKGLSQMYARDGVAGLFKGNGANAVRVAPYAALQFFAFEKFSEAYLAWTAGGAGKLGPLERLVLGGSAGVVAVTATYPLDYVRGRLSVQSSGTGAQYKGIMDALLTISRKEGPTSLYRGLTTTAVGIAPYLGTNFMVFGTLKEWVCGEERPSVLTSLVLGGIAGALAQTAGYPFDSIRRRIQVDGFAAGSKRNPAMDSMIGAFRYVIRTEGMGGLYRGLFANYSKIVPTMAVHWAVFEQMRELLGLPPKN